MLPHIKKYFYLLSLLTLVVLVGLIVAFREKDPGLPPLKDRTGLMATGSEWINTKASIETLQEKLRQNPEDHKSMILLAQVYLQEGRLTGNHNYYDLAALKLLKKVMEQEPNDYEARCALATVYLSQHHFQEALEIGLQVKHEYWHEALPYGILTDAYVELGRYEDAVRMADSMCAIRPDLKSYSRISYVREIFGDVEGAKEAMKMAVESGVPGMEQTEWCRVYLGRLYEMTGNLDTAALIYQTADQLRPNYAYAQAGLGRLEKVKKNYAGAIQYFETADGLITDYSFGEELMELYASNGEPGKSAEKAGQVVALLNEHSNTEEENGDAGHYSDKELAYVYLRLNDLEKAMKHAEAEYRRRPRNIEVNELMAWTHYRSGSPQKAVGFVEEALRTGNCNPLLLCRAGLIYCSAGQPEKGLLLIARAMEMNPCLDEALVQESKHYTEQSHAGSKQTF